MEERYQRNVPSLSQRECLLLRTKRVAVVGLGGIGGAVFEMLLRVGVGAITAIDGDCFEVSNLNRQLLSELDLVGHMKAEAAAKRAFRINPEVQVRSIVSFLTEDNAEELLAGCDVAVDALDSVSARRALSDACSRLGIPLVHGAIHGWTAQAAVSLPGDGLINHLYADVDEPQEDSTLSFTPMLCASLQAALCVKLLCGRPVETGKLYYMDLLHMETAEIPMLFEEETE